MDALLDTLGFFGGVALSCFIVLLLVWLFSGGNGNSDKDRNLRD